MVLIYTQQISPRLQYAAGLVLGTILGLQWELTADTERFRKHPDAKIIYGDKPSADVKVFIQASGFLHHRGVTPFVPEVSDKHDPPVLFPAGNEFCNMGYDIFSAAFYLASRYEEYLPHEKDRFGRFEAAESLAFRHGFLHRPVIDIYAFQLMKLLKQAYGLTNSSGRKFQYIPTIDIDVAYAYLGRGLIRNMLAFARLASRLEFNTLRERLLVLAGKRQDPFDTYETQFALHQKYQVKPRYFLLCGQLGFLDRNINTGSSVFKNLVMQLRKQGDIGIHPSAASNSAAKRLAAEINRLTAILNEPVTSSRQHYLMLQLPATYRTLVQHHITHDFSMGFASVPGFRAGTCTPYEYYDPQADSVTGLTVMPLMVMDGTLRDYLGLDTGQAIEIIRSLVKEVKSVNGTFVSLWHNDAFSDTGHWRGWRGVYEQMLGIVAE